jgi:hypothetical protein
MTINNNIPPVLPLCTLLNMTLTPSGVGVIRALSEQLLLCAIIQYKNHTHHDDYKYAINKYRKEKEGGYSSIYSSSGDAIAAVGATEVRNVSVVMHKTRFNSYAAIHNEGSLFCANAYGSGSFFQHLFHRYFHRSWL